MPATDVDVAFGADFAATRAALDKIESEIKSFSNRVQNLGIAAFVAWGAPKVFAALKSALSDVTNTLKGWVDAAIEAENVDQKLAFAVQKAGAAFQFTVEQLDARAKALARNSVFDDEAIKTAQTALITFKLYGDTLTRTTELAVDMASAMGTDVAQAAETLARSLSIPERGLMLLRRSGIEVTQSQKELIKSLLEVGDKTGAQAKILEILEARYKGAGQAATETAQGGMKQIANIFGDISEELGNMLLPYLKEAIPVIKELARAFLDFATTMKDAFLGNLDTFGPKFRSFLLDAAAWIKTFVDDSLMSIHRLMGEVKLTAATAQKFFDVTAIGDPVRMREIAKAIRDANKEITDNTPLTLFQDRVDANRTLLEGKLPSKGTIPFVNRPNLNELKWEGGGLPAIFKGLGEDVAEGLGDAFQGAKSSGALGKIKDGFRVAMDEGGKLAKNLFAQPDLKRAADRIRASQESSGQKGFQSGFEDAASTFKRIQSAVASTEDVPKRQLTALEKQIIQLDEANEQQVLQNTNLTELIKLYKAGLPAIAG